MKINKKIIFGMAICFIGAIYLELIVLNLQGQPAIGKSIPAFLILIVGAYLIGLGKKQQKAERENNH